MRPALLQRFLERRTALSAALSFLERREFPTFGKIFTPQQAITEEFELFVLTGNKCPNMEFVTRSLKNIEQTFSTAGKYVNKLRTRMNDDMLSNLVMLKSIMTDTGL